MWVICILSVQKYWALKLWASSVQAARTVMSTLHCLLLFCRIFIHFIHYSSFLQVWWGKCPTKILHCVRLYQETPVYGTNIKEVLFLPVYNEVSGHIYFYCTVAQFHKLSQTHMISYVMQLFWSWQFIPSDTGLCLSLLMGMKQQSIMQVK